MHATQSLLAALAFGTLALAQGAGSDVPPCLAACDDTANAFAGCAATDLLCHCEHANQVLDILIPCVFKGNNCTNAKAEIFAFEDAVAVVCALENITTVTNSLKLPPPVLLEPYNNSPYNGTEKLPLPYKVRGGH